MSQLDFPKAIPLGDEEVAFIALSLAVTHGLLHGAAVHDLLLMSAKLHAENEGLLFELLTKYYNEIQQRAALKNRSSAKGSN